MKNKTKIASLLLPFLFAASQSTGATLNGSSRSKDAYRENNSPEAKGLHLYKCNGHKFYAHNDNEALKRAKIKGYWTKDAVITLA